MPAVSVVVPCYNGGRFIAQLLGCLRAQTFQNFEIIIVDDGSTEPETRRVLDGLDPSIRVVRQENRGMSGARNTGFREARADLVFPLDCDDTIGETFIGEAVRLLRAAPPEYAFAFSHLRLAGAEDVIPRHFNPFDILFSNGMPSGMVMRKIAWETVGGYDEGFREGYEDWEFNIRLARFGFRGIEIPEPLYIYHLTREGMLLSRSTQMHAALWRRIRKKHAPLYRLPALLRLWRVSGGEVSLVRALGTLAMTAVLPDRWFNALIARQRLRRFERGLISRPPLTPEAQKP
jgi:glycosyltransferase involved in cell wall biosynthesis